MVSKGSGVDVTLNLKKWARMSISAGVNERRIWATDLKNMLGELSYMEVRTARINDDPDPMISLACRYDVHHRNTPYVVVDVEKIFKDVAEGAEAIYAVLDKGSDKFDLRFAARSRDGYVISGLIHFIANR